MKLIFLLQNFKRQNCNRLFFTQFLISFDLPLLRDSKSHSNGKDRRLRHTDYQKNKPYTAVRKEMKDAWENTIQKAQTGCRVKPPVWSA